MYKILFFRIFLILSMLTNIHGLPHSEMPDVTLECFKCSAYEKGPDRRARTECTDPRSNKTKASTVKCINQFCMRRSGHSSSMGHRVERGCGDDNVTEPGCKDLLPSRKESQRYACYCNQNKCNDEPGLVVERMEAMEIHVEGGNKRNSAFSFYLMREQFNGYFLYSFSLVIYTGFYCSGRVMCCEEPS